MATVTMRYWAAAKAAAGRDQEECTADTLAEALESVRVRHGEDGRLAAVLERCSFLVDETPVGARPHAEVRFGDQATVEVLPPFAGG
ncbi:MoaD/ThiS family protein [Spiractinospora alimapuensis]|uniref:MoaD/ThiS family protein n=1 Tax=Spiractinospora alimapuensis TaxID=2820884 RepID=UPI001F16E133|nr:MoaD/ThiS family protein [Spiractinospora alimapuensis]QVQ50613.1 MoaD/ThiS family protein [Spiractinospora alimapuensis]